MILHCECLPLHCVRRAASTTNDTSSIPRTCYFCAAPCRIAIIRSTTSWTVDPGRKLVLATVFLPISFAMALTAGDKKIPIHLLDAPDRHAAGKGSPSLQHISARSEAASCPSAEGER